MANRVIFDIGWVPFGIGHPPPTHQIHSTCVQEGSRVPNLLTEFNYLDLFKSYGIFSDFVVPTWSRGPHVVPVVPTSSPSSPRHPHHPQVIPIAPRRSPCGLWSPWSPWSPHVVSVVPTSSPSSPCRVIPMSSLSFPHHLEGSHIILNPPDTHSIHPPPPWGVGGLKSVKMQ